MAKAQGGDSGAHEHPVNGLTARFPKDNLTVLSHLYRGEVARANVWRQKMDMTTNWAIVSVTALISVAFTNRGATHLLLPFGSVLVFLLLNIEGRRYRFFDVWRTRVRMLEVHLMVPSLYHEKVLPEGNWREVLCNDLITPTYKISYWEAVGRRLQRNYIWIFAINVVAWVTKVVIHHETEELTLYESFGSGPLIPPWAVISAMVAFHLFLLVVLIVTIRVREATGEIRRKDPNRKLWPI